MRKPSRAMPPASALVAPASCSELIFVGVTLAAVLGGLGYVTWQHPGWMLALTVGLAGLVMVERRRVRRLVAARGPESSICAFARSFDCRRTDTRLLRAVYEELGVLLGSGRHPFPVRAADRLFGRRTLNMDWDDVDDVLSVAAARAGRGLESTSENPWFGKMETVADLVHFLGAQPEIHTLVGD